MVFVVAAADVKMLAWTQPFEPTRGTTNPQLARPGKVDGQATPVPLEFSVGVVMPGVRVVATALTLPVMVTAYQPVYGGIHSLLPEDQPL